MLYPKAATCKTVSQRRCARLKHSATQHTGLRQYLQFAIGLTETDRAFTRFKAIVWGCATQPCASERGMAICNRHGKTCTLQRLRAEGCAKALVQPCTICTCHQGIIVVNSADDPSRACITLDWNWNWCCKAKTHARDSPATASAAPRQVTCAARPHRTPEANGLGYGGF